MLKLPISAPHFETVSLNPGIRWIGVTQLELLAPKAIVRIAEAEAWCPPSTLCHACQPKILSSSLNLRERLLVRLFSWSRMVL